MEASLRAWQHRKNLEGAGNYQNARSRLPIALDAFFYLNPQQSELAPEMLLFEPLLQSFPALASGFQLREGQLHVETFFSADKERLDGAYYHPTERYEATLLEQSSEDFAWEWGGQNLRQQLHQSQELMDTTQPLLAASFRAALDTWLWEHWGLTREELEPFLEEEFYFAWNPQLDYVLMLEIASGQRQEAHKLEDLWEARKEPLRSKTHRGADYLAGPDFFLSFYEDRILLTRQEKTMQELIDRHQGHIGMRDRTHWDTLLNGADGFLRIPMKFFGKDSIIVSGQKWFDDGQYARSLIQFP